MGLGGEKSPPGHTDQNSPSSILCRSCFWVSGDTSSHSLALEQRQAVRGQEVPPFPQDMPSSLKACLLGVLSCMGNPEGRGALWCTRGSLCGMALFTGLLYALPLT